VPAAAVPPIAWRIRPRQVRPEIDCAQVAYLSVATDYVVSQVVDKTKGVHARIRKGDFRPRRGAGRR